MKNSFFVSMGKVRLWKLFILCDGMVRVHVYDQAIKNIYVAKFEDVKWIYRLAYSYTRTKSLMLYCRRAFRIYCIFRFVLAVMPVIGVCDCNVIESFLFC